MSGDSPSADGSALGTGAHPLSELARQAAQAVPEPHHADPHGAEGERYTAVNSEKTRSLYASHVKVYPKLAHGFFRRLKWLIMGLTLTVYYATPWLRWDRGSAAPDQAVLIDFPSRRFYFFWIEIWPQEIYYITGLLILAALILFLATSLAGRVWCGYTCPQTVWTDLFIHIERWIEGDRSARIRLDKSPWGLGKLSRKVFKHACWLLISVATGGAWVFYFGDAPTLLVDLLSANAAPAAYISIAVFTAATYTLGGLAREQVCTYMCPWPRIQGAMFDEQSFLVSYKTDRGEPRGPHKKGASWEGRGDCIDCGQCVAVCPAGIDIRDGMQLECIQCALCIDACNTIMDRVDRPRGLIAYDTLGNQQRRAEGKPEQLNFIRPRTIVYALMLVLVSSIMLFGLTTRSTLDINILRDRNPIFVTLKDGSVRNGYTIKIINKDHTAHQFEIKTVGLTGATLSRSRVDNDKAALVDVGPDQLRSLKLFLTLPASALDQLDNGEAAFRFTVTNTKNGVSESNDVAFRGPIR